MTYTNEQINAALKKALEDRGEDYVYPDDEKHNGGCMYATENGTPSCIVGYVLNELDPEKFAEVARWERDEDTADTAVGDAYLAVGLDLHRDQVDALEAAQVKQDQGLPWGRAAVEYMRHLGESEL